MPKIYCHNGTFHADEVTAIALLKVFKPGCYNIDRVNHQTADFPDADYVIDIGREYDNQTRFDHHQWEGGLSSVGLIWKHLNLSNYPDIDDLIEAVDKNDVGVKSAGPHEYPRLISLFNHTDIHGPAQLTRFNRAIEFAEDIIRSLKTNQDLINETGKICANAHTWNNEGNILVFPRWLRGWNRFVNGETRPNIEAVTWPDEELGTWNIQTTNKSTTSYEKVGRKLLPWDQMEFVHSNNFFAVAKADTLTNSKVLMNEYIRNYFK